MPTKPRNQAKHLQEMHRRLSDYFGPQHWWPADTSFEVLVGAVLTQNTAWRNAATAIAGLKERGLLSLEALRALSRAELAEHLRPAGYYNLKEQRLRNLLDMLARDCGGRLEALAELPLAQARELLLSVKGVGPETADSILLYAVGRPSFVVDAYTIRILSRHGLAETGADYHAVQEMFVKALPAEARVYNEMHALIVRLGNRVCLRTRPRCEECPLTGWPGKAWPQLEAKAASKPAKTKIKRQGKG